MSEHKTLLQFLLDLLHDNQAQADFREDPQGALHAAGLDHVCVQDIQHLLPVVLEKVDAEKCAKYEDDCDNGHCHDDDARHHDGHHDGHHRGDQHHDDHKWNDHDNEIDKVVTHLNYVVNNYSYDSHDTVYNTENITKIWADHGANVDVNNETHNVGAGGVSVEGDNSAPIATGGHNQIGTGNEMSGDGSTSAFGSGSALSHVGTGDGGAINTGTGSASGNAEHANFQNYGDGNLTAATHAPATASNIDSHDVTKTSTDSHDLTNSQNHDSGNTETHLHTEDSHDTNTLLADNHSTDVNAHESDVQVHDPIGALIP